MPIHESGLIPLLGPLVLNGVGFGLVVAALTAAAVNVVPPKLTGMAGATTSLVRDLGQTSAPPSSAPSPSAWPHDKSPAASPTRA